MEFKYTKNLVNEESEKRAEMLIFGAIGPDENGSYYNRVNGNYFADELKYVALNLGISDITLLINSVGGNVFEGYSILAIIQLLKEKGINVKTKNVGIAYSMAGIIAGCGTKGKRKIYDYATSMIHSPGLASKEEADEDMKDGIAKIKNSLVTILVNNTGLEKDKVLEMMSKDTFLTAKETLAAGMADVVEKTNNQIENKLTPLEKMAACAKVFNKDDQDDEKIINKNLERMKNINAILSLNAEASEDAQVTAIKELKAQATLATELQAKLKTADNKVSALTTENAALKLENGKAIAETMVNKAVEEGKISAEAKETWLNKAAEDFEGTKTLLDSLQVVPGSINNELKPDPKGEKALADKYQKMLVENSSELDGLTNDEEAKLVNAWEKHYKTELEITVE